MAAAVGVERGARLRGHGLDAAARRSSTSSLAGAAAPRRRRADAARPVGQDRRRDLHLAPDRPPITRASWPWTRRSEASRRLVAAGRDLRAAGSTRTTWTATAGTWRASAPTRPIRCSARCASRATISSNAARPDDLQVLGAAGTPVGCPPLAAGETQALQRHALWDSRSDARGLTQLGAGPTGTRGSCRAASSSASRSPARSPSSPRSSCSTSRCRRSTPRSGSSCARRSGRSSASSGSPRST